MQLLVPPRNNEELAKTARKAAPDTAGKSWYSMPATRIDEDMKRELRLLRLRCGYVCGGECTLDVRAARQRWVFGSVGGMKRNCACVIVCVKRSFFSGPGSVSCQGLVY